MVTPAPLRILVLDGRSNPALACVRSLGRAGHAVLVASAVHRPLAAWSRFCRGVYRHDGHTVPAFAQLRAWAARAGVSLVLPMSETTCVLANAERGQWEAAGITVGCAPPERLLVAFDKAATLAAAGACDVRTPRTVVPTSLEECGAAAAAVGYPCVIKPRISYAWDGTRVRPKSDLAFVTRAEELDATLTNRREGEPWPIVQEVVTGRGRGVFGLCDNGRVVAWFAHEVLRHVRPMATPSSLRRSAALEPRLREPAERLLGHMRWHGPAMVEFLDDGVRPPCLMEVNGRFWNSLALAVAAGVDFPRLWVRLLTGEPVPAGNAYREGVAVRWLWGDVKRALGAMFVDHAPAHGRPTAWEAVRDVFRAPPRGTRLEMWETGDPWPAVGEWVEAMREVWGWVGRDRSHA